MCHVHTNSKMAHEAEPILSPQDDRTFIFSYDRRILKCAWHVENLFNIVLLSKRNDNLETIGQCILVKWQPICIYNNLQRILTKKEPHKRHIERSTMHSKIRRKRLKRRETIEIGRTSTTKNKKIK